MECSNESRYVKGVSFPSKGYIKGIPFLPGLISLLTALAT